MRLRLYHKISVLIILLIIATVFVLTHITVRREIQTKTQEAKRRFTNLATVVGSLNLIGDSLAWEDVQRFIDLIDAQEYQGGASEGYRIPIVYLAAFDEQGIPRAYGVNFDFIDLRDEQGRPIQEVTPEVVQTLSSEEVGGTDVKRVRVQVEQGRSVEIGYSLKPLHEEIRALQRKNAMVAALFVIFGIASSVAFSKFLTRPLATLTKTMEKVSEGDFNQQVATTSRDEIGLLAENFNMMTAGLREREKIKSIFAKYISKQVAQEILAHRDELKLHGETREVTVLFADIRGYTSLSENLQPEEIVELLNAYFTVMVDIIFKYEGVLDKFIGDAIMAVWNVPIDQESAAIQAVKAAWEMQHALQAVNERLRREKGKEIHIGIGINTGKVVAGNLGSIKRMEYTVIGDNVNVAQRIESQTPRGEIYLSESTYQQVRSEVDVEPLEPLPLKGKKAPVQVYRLKQLK